MLVRHWLLEHKIGQMHLQSRRLGDFTLEEEGLLWDEGGDSPLILVY